MQQKYENNVIKCIKAAICDEYVENFLQIR